ncbi:RagB/SusD family nutrient uptake outer membrane protein [Sphingobacterium sp. SRCM116780]|uniref:RagB/SusD family nutrient uptake outer membrane protein n=1 Tax=Sphingobacterium sp. SRCM116780 TaxID=2907623 RepID=UPI001F3D4479|nr:RagB/SusD family nutrient uptake outer membrane protein [Sphingobacterium sp. SRCM116780]UIR56031.1 RagB/SusD family nutrient uptake outer membrane protein [Sphingobacterium sp. SRCM116780]
MKINKFSWMLMATLSLTSLNGCKNYLDQVPDDVITVEDIFKSKANTDKFLANIYSTIPNELVQRFTNYANGGPWTAASDEAKYTWDFNYANNMTSSVWSNTDGVVAGFWNNYYEGIRNASYFIQNIDNANPVEVTSVMKSTYKAEARALRALYYYYLVRTYGAVPLIGEQVLDINAPIADLKLARTPFDACIDYIVSELDEAYKELPYTPSNSEYGRITKGVVKAYKAEALLLKASPLFNGNSEFSAIKNPDGTALFSATADKQKWTAAAAAAKAFIDEFVPTYYNLYQVTNADPFVAAYLSCRNVMTVDWNQEWIFARSNSDNNTQYDRTPKHVGFPSAAQGGGALGATQGIVDAYFMQNGLPTTDANSEYSEVGFANYKAPYDVTERTTFKMYVNREPRFYVGITYSGSYWLNQANSSSPIISLFNYSGNSGRSQSASDVTPTGYTVRKNVSSNDNARGALLLRLANIYLDYAEALNESSPDNADILKYVNLIRKRAGIPGYGEGNVPLPAGQVAMREAIRKERRVELAFENVRYFDTRRWKIAEGTDNGPIYGMNLNADGNDFFKRTLIETRIFKKRDYLFPIPNNEVLKNENLIQNVGW